MNQNAKTNAGFTLIELMLAMSFISVLLVAIAITTIQISNIYTKGITLREVNQSGRTISDDLQRSIAQSAAFDPAGTGPDASYVTQANGGRLCVGKYSYLWNYGESLATQQAASQMNQYSDSDQKIRMAKSVDPDHSLCVTRDGDNNPVELEQPGLADTTEMLASGDRDLALHSFTLVRTAQDAATNQAMYAITFILGTNDQAQLTTNDASCQPPSDGVGAEDYCAVNQFDIVARSGNQSEGQ